MSSFDDDSIERTLARRPLTSAEREALASARASMARGEFTAAKGSRHFGFTATGIYSYLGTLHGWVPDVITAAVVLMLANYVGFRAWKAHHATIDQARIAVRQSPAFRAHVADLHKWAHEAEETLNWDEQRTAVEMGSTLAKCFAIHYPDAAAAVEEINERVANDEVIVREFQETAETIAAMVPNRAPGCAPVMRWIGMHAEGVESLNWKTGDGGWVNLTAPDVGGTFIVVKAEQGIDADASLAAVKAAATLMWQHPASVALRTIADDTPLRTRAMDALAETILDHNPPHECRKCEGLLSGY